MSVSWMVYLIIAFVWSWRNIYCDGPLEALDTCSTRSKIAFMAALTAFYPVAVVVAGVALLVKESHD